MAIGGMGGDPNNPIWKYAEGGDWQDVSAPDTGWDYGPRTDYGGDGGYGGNEPLTWSTPDLSQPTPYGGPGQPSNPYWDPWTPSPSWDGGVPTRDQRGQLLSDSTDSTLVMNQDGTWTNRPTNLNAQYYGGSQSDYAIAGPGGGGGGGPVPPGAGAGQGLGYNTTPKGVGAAQASGPGAYSQPMSFDPNWNLADAQTARNNRMNSAKPDVFDEMHNFKSPSTTSRNELYPGSSGEGGVPKRGSGSGSTTVQTQTNIMPATTAPTFVRPEVDQAKIESRIQEIMAPASSSLKRTIREAMARRMYSSPTLQKFALQGAVEGYGNALGDIQSKARQQGRSSYYAEDWQPRWQEAMTNYNSQLQQWMNQIQRQTVTENF